jgi:PKD repeat protein
MTQRDRITSSGPSRIEVAVFCFWLVFSGALALAAPSSAASRPLRGAEAVHALGPELSVLARRHGLAVAELRTLLVRDHSLWVDRAGELLHVCEFGIEAADAAPTATGGAILDSYPLDQTFMLHSNPSASRVIYLDFDGHVTTGTYWNSSYAGGSDIVSAPFSQDSDPGTFSSTELQAIQQIFQRVAEDYMPFDVDVTTEDPGADALVRSDAADAAYGVRVVISPTRDWLGASAGGIAYVGSFRWATDTPCFAFSTALANSERYIGEAVSHEAGHTLGLFHDGTTDGTEYYSGHGDWAPIMGVGYYKSITQWSKGEYAAANNTEDDLLIMPNYGATAKADDHGDVPAQATQLAGGQVNLTAAITAADDVDVFAFTVGAGTVSLNISPAPRGPNLDIEATLRDSNGALIAQDNPAGLSASIVATVPAGTYYLTVDGVGTGDPTTGYSDYASLGQYTLSGTVPSVGNLAAPTAAASASPVSGTAPLTVGFDSSGSADPDGVIVSTEWTFGDGSTSSLPAPAHVFTEPGDYAVILTVTDNDGLTATDSVLISASAPPNELPVAVAAAQPTSGYAPLTVAFSSADSYDPDGVVVSTSWDFGDGGSSNASEPVYVYNFPGQYTASLLVADDRGGQAATTVVIDVAQDPAQTVYIADIGMTLVNVPGGIAARTLVSVQNVSGAPVEGATVTATWSGLSNATDTAATDAGGIAVFESRKTKKDGVFVFEVLDVLAAGSDYDPTLNVETQDSISTGTPANQSPTAVLSATPETGAAPLAVVFDASGSSDPDGVIADYRWDFGDGTTGAGLQIEHTYSTAGQYQATLTVTDDQGATDSATTVISATGGEAQTIFVSAIDMAVVPTHGGVAAEAAVTVVDTDGNAVPGATVTGQWDGPKSGTDTAVTGSDGVARLNSPKVRGSFTYVFSVVNVQAPGAIYDPTRNLETSDSISQ